MSVSVMSWVFRSTATTGNDRLVLLAIADSAEDDGSNAWPGIKTIACRANVSTRTAQRCIASLRDAEHILVEPRAGGTADCRDDRRPNRYTVVMSSKGNDTTTVSPRESDDTTNGAARGDNPVMYDTTLLSYKTSSIHPDPLAPADADAVEIASLTEVIIEVCGFDANSLTETEKSRIGKSVKEIRKVGGTPDDVRQRAASYRRTHPAVLLTDRALVSAWSRLGSTSANSTGPVVDAAAMAGHKAANIGLSLNDAAELFADTLPNPADRERARRVYIDRTSGSTESKQLVRSVG